MSRTLADVGADMVHTNTDGDYVWMDRGGTVIYRRRDGRIGSMGMVAACDVSIVGECLGSSADDPWRKAVDKGQPGSLTDAHNRIDELASMVSNHGYELGKLAERIAALEQRPSVPVEPVNQCNAPPTANPTQPPDVAVYRYAPGETVYTYEYPLGDAAFNRETRQYETRTVLDAFDRLTWDELRRWGLSVLGPAYDIDTWDILRIGGQTVSKHPTEREALTAARAIARKEGWR